MAWTERDELRLIQVRSRLDSAGDYPGRDSDIDWERKESDRRFRILRIGFEASRLLAEVRSDKERV